MLEQLRQAGKNVSVELRQKQQLLLSIEARLDNLSKQTIIDHYTELHNALDPNHQLVKGAALEYYGRIPDPPEDLSNLSPLPLIRRLEELHQVEVQRLEDADAAAMQPVNQEWRNRLHNKISLLRWSYESPMLYV